MTLHRLVTGLLRQILLLLPKINNTILFFHNIRNGSSFRLRSSNWLLLLARDDKLGFRSQLGHRPFKLGDQVEFFEDMLQYLFSFGFKDMSYRLNRFYWGIDFALSFCLLLFCFLFEFLENCIFFQFLKSEDFLGAERFLENVTEFVELLDFVKIRLLFLNFCNLRKFCPFFESFDHIISSRSLQIFDKNFNFQILRNFRQLLLQLQIPKLVPALWIEPPFGKIPPNLISMFITAQILNGIQPIPILHQHIKNIPLTSHLTIDKYLIGCSYMIIYLTDIPYIINLNLLLFHNEFFPAFECRLLNFLIAHFI